MLHARATRHRVENFSGPLSIKTVIAGEVTWSVGGRELLVDPASFLVLAAGETYSMNIAVYKPVETCCVFFAPGFVEQIASDITLPLHKTLDVQPNPPPGIPYLSALHTDRDRVMIRRVKSLARASAPIQFEEKFIDLSSDLLHLYQHIRNQIARLPAVRSSTRQELFRRLLIGREYIHSHISEPISLAAISRAAGLSLFHFHRGFKQAFQQTPHSYLTHLRLANARHMLETGSPVLDACLSVGFSSPSAFSRLFQSCYGELPSMVRRKLARSGKNSN